MRANRVATRLRHELQSFQEAHIWGVTISSKGPGSRF
jgi:hypothetical protein